MDQPADTAESSPIHSSARKRFCTGCGTTECVGCLADLEAPRHCRECGHRLRVRVRPGGWIATCRTCDIEIHSP